MRPTDTPNALFFCYFVLQKHEANWLFDYLTCIILRIDTEKETGFAASAQSRHQIAMHKHGNTKPAKNALIFKLCVKKK